MRFAYADPPYPGQAKRLYGDHPDYRGEVDHRDLIDQLSNFDAWALSTSASALHAILPLCPAPVESRKNRGRYLNGTGTRILVWVKPQTVWRPVDVQWAWEPILICGGRPRDGRGYLRDWIECNPREGNRFVGSKPYAVCRFIFEALGAEPDDEFADLYPGSGAVMEAWNKWCGQMELAA